MASTAFADANPSCWRCPQCTAVNATGAIICKLCLLAPPPAGQWACTECSLLNKNEDLACVICYVTKPTARFRSVIWEWTPDNERWIPYDEPTSTAIERAYSTNAKTIDLNTGTYFSQFRGTYKFYLNRPTKTYYQKNVLTHFRRPARRRSNEHVFVTIDPATLEANDRCVMCQEDFSDVDDATVTEAERTVVRLKVCHGHFFHKECISQFVMIRERCPVCFARVDVL
ncbi:uncharacterized protein EV422DRAFT_421101 [Fimicolochytrium jonesii]|uniref:uncharacterized protein n=1 Tax=Fimicolochytrium jonesii TaxID=1396493 RepID=UPI0022FDF58D|nr:uncharacterized protein EV422DRAFT_421101 [Fimicolochytrium jonesii]KAI8822205.1 hypothetical protein EV422DRAFT_421101 [Fimicolochytrium jonesii]